MALSGLDAHHLSRPLDMEADEDAELQQFSCLLKSRPFNRQAVADDDDYEDDDDGGYDDNDNEVDSGDDKTVSLSPNENK